jgi:hypothetical protein
LYGAACADVLEIPKTGLAIDGARANCPLAADTPPSVAIYANHSTRPNARLQHVPASAEAADRILLVAKCRIPAGCEVRFDCTPLRPNRRPRHVLRASACCAAARPVMACASLAQWADENGGRRGSYWGGRRRPVETRWRDVVLHPPPPTCREPLRSGTSQAVHLPPSPEPRSPFQLIGAAAASGQGGGGEADGGYADDPSEQCDAAEPVAWHGARGGDALLTAVVGLLQGSEWLRQCVQRADGKTRMWQLVASHLPGRTPTECMERWRMLSRKRSRQASPPRAGGE